MTFMGQAAMRRHDQNSKVAKNGCGFAAIRLAAMLVSLAPASAAVAQTVQISGNVFPVTMVGQPTPQVVTLTALVDDAVIQNLAVSSTGGGNEYYITNYGTCAVGAYVTAGTSCTFTVTFNPQFPGYAQSPAPIGRWAHVSLEYTDQVYGGNVFLNYPLTGTGNGPNQVVTPGLISDIVGNDVTPHIGFGGDGGPASGATFAQPSAIAEDTFGNLYITESGSSVVRVVYKGGTVPNISSPVVGNIYTIAGVVPAGGVSQAGPGTDSVIATQSPLNNPTGVALDPLGNLYIADSANNAIREVVAATGYVFTVAGTLNAANGYAGDRGAATSALLANPSGVSVDGYGNIYIADNGNNVVRVVYEGGAVLASLIATENPGTTVVVGNIYTIAGGPNAAQAANGDGGLATLANLNAPNAVVVDSAGDVYIADYSNRAVRRVDAMNGKIGSIASGIDNPVSLAVDAGDDIYFNGHSYCTVMQYNPSLQAGLATPYLNMVAGNGICQASGDGNGATNAGLSGAEGVVVDSPGNLYLLEADGVRLVSGKNAQGGIATTLNFGNINVGNVTALDAIVTDENILPAPGANSVDVSQPGFQLDGYPRDFSIGDFVSANPNIPDCTNAVPPVYAYLTPGKSCGVEIDFSPDSDGGPFTGGAYQYGLQSNGLYISFTGSGVGSLTTATLTGTPTIYVADLKEATSPPQTFVVTNTGSSTLQVSGIGIAAQSGSANGYFYASYNCGAAVNSRYVIPAGGSCAITVAFTGTAVGNVTAMLQVTDNASSGDGVQTLSLNGTVVAPLGEFVDASSNVITTVTYPLTAPGSSSALNILFTNAGGAVLAIDPASWIIRGANQTAFHIVNNSCGSTLGLGASCSLAINFNPPALMYGNYTAVLQVQDDSGGQPLNNGNHTYIQQSVNLNGPTGNAPAQTSSFTLQNGAFPAEALGVPITQTVSLVLNEASNVVSVATGAGSEYTVGTYAACTGPAGTTCAIPITFTPTGIGSRPGTLIVGNLESGVTVPYFLPLTGSGIGTLAALTPGIISTVVGGAAGQSVGIVGNNGPAAQAQVGSLSDMAMDNAGDMFLADQQNEVIWKVDTTGQAYLYAGTPLPTGVSYQQRLYGDGGAALGADLAYLGPIALDAKGGLYVGAYDEIAYGDAPRIRYIDPSTKIINTVVGYIPFYFWQASSQFFGGNPLRVVLNGTAYLFLAPGGGVSGNSAPAWPTTQGSTVQDGTITWINEGLYTATNGCASQVDSIGDGCPAQDVTIGVPTGLAIDSAGDLYFSEFNYIRRMDATTSIVTLVAGNGTFGYSPDGTVATQAAIEAGQLAFDSHGNLYFADNERYVRKIDKTTGILSTITGNATSTNNNICGAAPGEGGSATGVPYSLLNGIAFDAADNLYIADPNACVIRRIDAVTQTIHTVAGVPNGAFPLTNTGYGDLGQPNSDGSALEAELSEPVIVKLDNLANLYIASGYGGVRKVDVSQSVLPFAGPFGQSTYTQLPFTVSAPLTTTVLNAGNSGNLLFTSPFFSVSWGINSNNFIRDITDPTGSPDCYDLELLIPGAECPVNIDFVPQASSRTIVTAQDSVTDNAPTSPQVIQLSGIGFGPTPSVTLTPSLISIFTPQASSSAPQPLTLTNQSMSLVLIGSITITGTGASAFSQTNNCGAQLAAQSACTIMVTFSPPYLGTTPDNLKATLSVPESADSAPKTAELAGVGTAPVPLPLNINEAIHVSDGTPTLTPSTLLPINETIQVSDSPNVVPMLVGTTASLQYTPQSGAQQLTVTVNPAAATGSVYLFDGAVRVADGVLSNGIYTYAYSFAPGVHQFHATYYGSDVYSGSTTNTVQVIVQTTLTVTAQNTNRAFATANPALGFQITGFVNGDTAANLSGAPLLSTTAVLNSIAGSYPITAAQGTLSAPAYYNINFVPGTLTVNGSISRVIIFLPFPSTIPMSKNTLTLTAHSGSALPVAYEVSGPAILSGSSLTLTGTGLVTITATQPGNATFSAATPVVQSFEVTQ
jgi:sugar lactone lactonase YvrE